MALLRVRLGTAIRLALRPRGQVNKLMAEILAQPNARHYKHVSFLSQSAEALGFVSGIRAIFAEQKGAMRRLVAFKTISRVLFR